VQLHQVPLYTREEIAKNDFNISPSRYIHTGAGEEYRPIVEIVEELNALAIEARVTETGDVRCLRRGRRHGESHRDGRGPVHPVAKKFSTVKAWRDKEEFKARVLEWANKLDVKAHSLAVRPMRRKWASCSTAGKLNERLKQLTLLSFH